MLVLEFSTDRIKLLEAVKKKKRITLINLTKRPIGTLSDGAISNVISDMISEMKVKKPDAVNILIPQHQVMVRNLNLPSVDEAELKGMVALQVSKQLPYPAAELIWDYRIIEKRPDGYSYVLLIVVHSKIVDKFISILHNAKFKIGKLLLSSEALCAWYLAARGVQEEEAETGKVRAIVDVDSSRADIIILHDDKWEFSRSFPFREYNAEEITEEVKKTFYSYQKEKSKQISSIVLTGIEERALALKAKLEEMYGSKGISFIHSLKIVTADYQEALSDYFDASRDVSFSSMLGIGFNPAFVKMNLLPAQMKEKNTRERQRKVLARTTALLLALFIAVSGIFTKQFIETRDQLAALRLRMKEIEPEVKRLKRISQDVEIVKKHIDMKGSGVDVMRELYKIIPEGISISVLDLSIEKSLRLKGVSTDLSSVFKFTSSLEKSDYFEDCEPKYAQKRKLKTKELVDFEINCKLSVVN